MMMEVNILYRFLPGIILEHKPHGWKLPSGVAVLATQDESGDRAIYFEIVYFDRTGTTVDMDGIPQRCSI